MSAKIVPFADPVNLDLPTVGGKGLNLSRLYRAGFPVPPGFTVASMAYDSFVRRHGLAELIAASLQSVDLNDARSLDSASEAIRTGFPAHEMPCEIADDIRAAYAAMGHPPVAVRSSATAEDLPGSSFAGLQETVLNVVTDDALSAAVIRCWSSLWTARAIAYRVRNAVDLEGLSLAVVVQAMVDAEASGVLFTANPLTGRRDEVVIDATLGLGEALVSGQVEPDHFVVDASGRILRRTLGNKGITIHSREGGGTVAVQQDLAHRQALPDATVLALAQLGRRVAALLGGPQDIEWALAGGELVLLQARPITTLYPLPNGMPAEPLRAMLSFGAVQGMLDPMTPLGRDAITAALVGAGKVFGSHASVDTQSLLWTAGERLWVDVSGLLGNRPGRWIALAAMGYVDPSARLALRTLVDEGRFPPPGRVRMRTALRIIRAFVPMLVSALRTLLRPDVARRRLMAYLEAMLGDFQVRLPRASGMVERLQTIRQLTDEAFHYVMPQFIPRFGPGMGAYNLLTHLAAGLPAGTCDSRVMMRGVPYNVTTEMDLDLWETAQTIRADAVAAAQFQLRTPEALAQAYQQGALAPVAQEAIGQFLERYGVRGFAEIDIGRPRWREEPQPIFQTLCSYLAMDDGEEAPDVVFERGARAALAEVDRLATALRKTRGGRIKAAVARWAASRMRALVGLREAPKLTMMRAFGPMREALLADGACLVAEGVFERADDVFYLHLRELETLAADQHTQPCEACPGEQQARGAGSPTAGGQSSECSAVADQVPNLCRPALVRSRQGVSSLVRTRREAWTLEQRRRQIPRLLLSDGQASYGGAAPSPTDDATVLRGDPVSPGSVDGTVYVVLDPRSTQLPPGAILVCPGTDPVMDSVVPCRRRTGDGGRRDDDPRRCRGARIRYPGSRRRGQRHNDAAHRTARACRWLKRACHAAGR